MLPFLVLLILFLANGATLGMIGTQITDEIELGVPIDKRPSWQIWKTSRFPLAELQQHRNMYAASRQRKLYV